MKTLFFSSLLGISTLFGCPRGRVSEPTKIEKVRIFLDYRIERTLTQINYDFDKDIDATEDIAKLEAYVDVWEFINCIDNDKADW